MHVTCIKSSSYITLPTQRFENLLPNNTMCQSYKHHHIVLNKKYNQSPLSLSLITPRPHLSILEDQVCCRHGFSSNLTRLCTEIRLLARNRLVFASAAAAPAAMAAVSQVFGCVWLHHLVSIATSSKNWQDFQQTPSFLYSGVKHRNQCSIANSQVYLNISQPEGWEQNNTSYESKSHHQHFQTEWERKSKHRPFGYIWLQQKSPFYYFSLQFFSCCHIKRKNETTALE